MAQSFIVNGREKLIMNSGGCGRNRPWLNLRICAGIYLEGLRKSITNLKKDKPSMGRDLNSVHNEYESEQLPTWRRFR